jgi:hypothetical protein
MVSVTGGRGGIFTIKSNRDSGLPNRDDTLFGVYSRPAALIWPGLAMAAKCHVKADAYPTRFNSRWPTEIGTYSQR